MLVTVCEGFKGGHHIWCFLLQSSRSFIILKSEVLMIFVLQ
jgi:hypothetical protein